MSILTKKYWYEKSTTEKHEEVFAALKIILDSGSGSARQQSFAKYAKLYGNMEVPLSYGLQMNYGENNSRLTYNVVKSCCDTLTSKITQQVPSVMFLTDGEDFFKQDKAQKANKYIDACFYATKFKTEAKKSFLDSSLFGLGAIKIIADKLFNTLRVERTLPLELFVDEFDAAYGSPRNLFQRKIISKDCLKVWYKDYVKEIDASKLSGETTIQRLYEQTDVVEAWHLPTSPDSKDGRHVICINNCTLLDEEWNKPYFPFVFLHFTDPLMGFWASGLGEMLIGLQLEINKTLKVIRQIMEYSVPKLILPAGSSIATQHLTNYVMDIIKVIGGGDPKVMQLASANPQLFTYLGQLFQKAYEIAGISQMSAQAVKPAGLNSGRAIRNFYQIESERYAVTEQKWEQFFVDSATIMLSESKELPKFRVKSVAKSGIEELSWKDIDLKEDEYRIQAFPISSLPKTPAGRLETVTDLIQANFITREQGLELLNYPDINSITDREMSGRKYIRKIVDRIMLKGELTSPEKFDDLAYGVEYAQKSYSLGKLNNLPEERQDKLIQFMEECSAMLKSISAPPQDMPPEVGAEAPLAVPEKVPQTDLLALSAGGAEVPPPVTEQVPLPPIPEGVPQV